MSSPTYEPSITVLNDAFYPGFTLFKPGEVCSLEHPSRQEEHVRLFTGAIYDSAGVLCAASDRVGGVSGDRLLSISPRFEFRTPNAARITGRTAFLGHFMAHYGHFITENLSRCWALEEIGACCNFVAFPSVFSDRLLETHLYLYRAVLGFTPDVQVLRSPTVFEEILVPSQAWRINQAAMGSTQKVYERVRNSVTASRPHRRIFLSRSSGLQQRFQDPSVVEAAFRAEGFDIVYPESLQIEAQLRIYKETCFMAGFSGSALHNIVFCEPGTRLLEVGDERTPVNFPPMQAAANALVSAVCARVTLAQVASSSLSREDVFKNISIAIKALDPDTTQ